MEFENRIRLENEIRSDFKKLAKMSEEDIMKQAKAKELKNMESLYEWEYYVNQVFNPLGSSLPGALSSS